MTTPLRLAVLSLGVQAALLVAVYWLSGGQEFSDDVAMHLAMGRQPFSFVDPSAALRPEQPPLLALVLSPSSAASAVLGPFWGARVVAALVTAITVGVLAKLGQLLMPSSDKDLLGVGLVLWALSPLTWMSSVVVPQDEPWGALALALIVLLVARGRLRQAVWLSAVSCIALKIYFALALAGLAAFAWKHSLRRGWLLGPLLLPVVAYGWAWGAPWLMGSAVEGASYQPSGYFSTSAWAVLLRQLPAIEQELRMASKALAPLLGLAVAVLWGARSGSQPSTARESGALLQAIAGALLVFFSTFYLFNPEYLLLAYLPLVFLLPQWRDQMVLHLTATLPWAANVFDAMGRALVRGNAHPRIQSVATWLPVELVTALHAVMCIASSAALVYWAWRVFRLERPRQMMTPEVSKIDT